MKWNEVLEIFVAPKESRPNASMPGREGDAAVTPSGPPSPTQAENFKAADLYRRLGVPQVAFTAEQALDLLGVLPKGFSDETKRQGLKELLEENSTSSAAVAEDVRRKVEALAAAADNISGESADFITATEDEITKIEAEIREKREAIERAKATEEQITQHCHTEADRLKSLLQFLGAERSERAR